MPLTSEITPSVPSSSVETPAANTQPATGPTGFRGVLSRIAGFAANIATPGLGATIGGLIGANSSLGTLNNDPMQYLQLQQQVLSEARAFETASNVLKAKHDSAMAAIRNVRPS